MAGVPPAGPRFKFSQAQRLRQSWEFERTRLEGQRLARGCLVLNWMPARKEQEYSRLGVVTSRKIGGAIVRSRARRLLREAFRRHQHELRGPLDIVLVARPSIAGKEYSEVERDFIAAATQARIIREVK